MTVLYVSHVRSGFISHRDEDDDERIRHVLTQAESDMAWILEKVHACLPNRLAYEG